MTGSSRTHLALFASAAFTGIALSVLDLEVLGGLVTVSSLVAFGWAIHRFGRGGPDEPLRFGPRS